MELHAWAPLLGSLVASPDPALQAKYWVASLPPSSELEASRHQGPVPQLGLNSCGGHLVL